ncbi:RlmI/RlmK family 23S rRNA methyltransferase [Halalkalibacillus sediminis]|uniref:RlmI/RlmK family 23S rRNA methyltransferase n=1 Tax=Halalkalibacillus sediminis TaxID=2018042 RepID=A0A2I0QTB4_9BACI|nr:class I SAM-dependent rRNA methyltransferase [Halalkalibacillus sediminis]PKR77581.1 RlmI/RlmK family 23S rRNA methyltransferase [Halalkalibacillus sediminis]
MVELILNTKFIRQYQNKFPLIRKEAILNPEVLSEEGEIIHLVDANHQFVAKGYYGEQNKGLGWVLTYNESEKIDTSFFKNRILTAINKRQPFFNDKYTNTFRIFNGEGDGIGGLTIEYFDGYYVINWYSEGIYSYKQQVISALEEVIDYKAIYEKKRFDTKGKYIDDDDFVQGTRGEFPLIVKENGMNFAVYLNDGAMTGIFLDQRDVRRVIRDKYARGKHVLNTFSYTGAFSVAAALGRASKTTSVDLAKRSKSKTIEQFSINGIDFEQQDIYVMDVFDYFKYAKRKEKKFDMVVLDPPSFARSKKRTFSTAKDYPGLIKDTLDITEKNGVIVASTNTASFDMNQFKKLVDKGFKESGEKYQILEEYSLPQDFKTNKQYKQSNYLKVLIVKKL